MIWWLLLNHYIFSLYCSCLCVLCTQCCRSCSCVVSADNRCFPPASCSEGSTTTISPVSFFLASRTVTISLLARCLKRSPGPGEGEPLYLEMGSRDLLSALTFSIYCYSTEQSDCMLGEHVAARNAASHWSDWVTCEPDSCSHKAALFCLRCSSIFAVLRERSFFTPSPSVGCFRSISALNSYPVTHHDSKQCLHYINSTQVTMVHLGAPQRSTSVHRLILLKLKIRKSLTPYILNFLLKFHRFSFIFASNRII